MQIYASLYLWTHVHYRRNADVATAYGATQSKQSAA